LNLSSIFDVVFHYFATRTHIGLCGILNNAIYSSSSQYSGQSFSLLYMAAMFYYRRTFTI